MLKPVMAYLHSSGFISTLFIDDILLIGGSELECVGNSKILSFFFSEVGVCHTSRLVGSKVHSYCHGVIHAGEERKNLGTGH